MLSGHLELEGKMECLSAISVSYARSSFSDAKSSNCNACLKWIFRASNMLIMALSFAHDAQAHNFGGKSAIQNLQGLRIDQTP